LPRSARPFDPAGLRRLDLKEIELA
jgi:hypothetical protein